MAAHTLELEFKAELAETTSKKTKAEFSFASKSPVTRQNFRGGRAAGDLSSRKLDLLKRGGLFGEDTRGAVIHRACTFEDLKQAFHLVHDVYLRSGYITPEPSGLRIRLFEALSENATFVAKKDGVVIGTLSIVGDSPETGLPSDEAFKPELDGLRAAGARLCELSNQAVLEEYRKSAVPTELMRCALAHAVEAGFDHGVATVSPSHNGFYDLMGFRQVGEQRSYSDKLEDPVIALSIEFARFNDVRDGMSATERFFHHFLKEGNRYYDHVARWAHEARSNFLNPEMLARLFVLERNFLAECSAADLNILRSRWGQELFDAVTETWRVGAGAASGARARAIAATAGRWLAREIEEGVVQPLRTIADIVLPPIEKIAAGCGGALLALLMPSRDESSANSPAEV